MSEIIGRICFLLNKITAVFFVFQQTHDHSIRPILHKTRGLNTFFTKLLCNQVCAFSFVQIHMEDTSDYICAFFIDIQFSVSNVITQHISAEHNALLHHPALTPFAAFRRLTALFLSDRRHYCQAKFSVGIKRVDVVVHKIYAYPYALELSGIADTVENVTGKSGYLLGYDQIKFMLTRIGYHPVKSLAFLCIRAGDTLVHIDIIKFPQRISPDKFIEVSLLTIK